MVYTSVCPKLLNQHYGENSLCITLWPDVARCHNLPQTYVRNSPPIGLKPNKHLRKFLQTLLHVPYLHVHVGLKYHLSIFYLSHD